LNKYCEILLKFKTTLKNIFSIFSIITPVFSVTVFYSFVALKKSFLLLSMMKTAELLNIFFLRKPLNMVLYVTKSILALLINY